VGTRALHDALPISTFGRARGIRSDGEVATDPGAPRRLGRRRWRRADRDRGVPALAFPVRGTPPAPRHPRTGRPAAGGGGTGLPCGRPPVVVAAWSLA